MPIRRIKVSVMDEEGNKITISFEGQIHRNKVLQLLDITELIGGFKVDDKPSLSDLSIIDKVKSLLKSKFPIGWFTSQEVMISYEDTFNEPIGLSTVSTYLARLTNKGILSKSGSKYERRYKIRKHSKANRFL